MHAGGLHCVLAGKRAHGGERRAGAQVSTIIGASVPAQREEQAWTEGIAIWVAVLVVSLVGARPPRAPRALPRARRRCASLRCAVAAQTLPPSPLQAVRAAPALGVDDVADKCRG
jgi:hypothetical protein